MKRGAWSSLELLRLRALFPRTPVARLARLLQRSPASVLARGTELCGRTNRRGAFQAEEDQILRTAVGVHDLATMARLVGRTEREVEARLVHLAKPTRRGDWTGDEERRLRRWFGSRDLDALVVAFARSATDIRAKAQELCLGRDRTVPAAEGEVRSMPRWSRAEIRRLRQLYPTRDTVAVARLLGRSAASVRNKASQLGLGKSDASRRDQGRRNVAVRWTVEDRD
ncbi:MAG: hypothetical protein AB7I19_15830 [Planctomycetota bacterium]